MTCCFVWFKFSHCYWDLISFLTFDWSDIWSTLIVLITLEIKSKFGLDYYAKRLLLFLATVPTYRCAHCISTLILATRLNVAFWYSKGKFYLTMSYLGSLPFRWHACLHLVNIILHTYGARKQENCDFIQLINVLLVIKCIKIKLTTYWLRRETVSFENVKSFDTVDDASQMLDSGFRKNYSSDIDQVAAVSDKPQHSKLLSFI